MSTHACSYVCMCICIGVHVAMYIALHVCMHTYTYSTYAVRMFDDVHPVSMCVYIYSNLIGD